MAKRILLAVLLALGLIPVPALSQTDTPKKTISGPEPPSSRTPASSQGNEPVTALVQEEPGLSTVDNPSTFETEIGLVGGVALLPDPDGWYRPGTAGLDLRFSWRAAQHVRLGFRIGLVAGFDRRGFQLVGGSVPIALVVGFELGPRWSLDLSVGNSVGRPLIGLGLAADVWRGSGTGIRLRLLFDYLPTPFPRPSSCSGGGGIGVAHFMFPQAAVLVAF